MNIKKVFLIVSIIAIFFLLVIFFLFSTTKKETKINEIKFDNQLVKSKVISNSYLENGFEIKLTILNALSPTLLLVKDESIKEIDLIHIHDNDYKVIIMANELENGKYKIYVKENASASQLINNLDLLDKLVKSKIDNKLLTFDYKNNYMSFEIEDFNYEYDILIDPGHGGIDAGTINQTMNEAKLNLLQSLYEKERYEKHGLKVLLARSDDNDGMLSGNKEWNRAKQRGYAIGDLGVLSKIVYSNHHNSAFNNLKSGFELLVSNKIDKKSLETELKILKEINEVYPIQLSNNTFQIYSRDYENGDTFNKIDGKIYSYRDYYATIRIPLELYNVKTVTYEGCYMSNQENFNWYYFEEGWKTISEIKIKNYVESLGKTYIPL